MKVFNRIIVILLLVGLLLLGGYAIVYAFDLFEYTLSDLPSDTGLPGIFAGVESFVRAAEGGAPPVFGITVLVLVALLGLLLLILELKPPAPRRVRLDEGTFITRGAVEDEVVDAAESTPDVLGSSAVVTARRRPGAKVQVQADVRRGEDMAGISSAVQQRVQERMRSIGVPVARLRVNPVAADPRETKTRVR